MKRAAVLATLVSGLAAGWSTPATAQIPTEYTNLRILPEDISRGELMGYMRAFSLGTGLRCNHCHVAEDPGDFSTFDFASDDLREKRIAREMLRMVQRLNSEVLAALPDRGSPKVEVGCVTCHAGRRRPTTLEQEMLWAHQEGGAEALEARYEELREEYFGLGALNFGSRSLEQVAQGLLEADPGAALRAVELNLEHHPASAQSWNLKGAAHEGLEQHDEAIAAYERALEINPQNPPARRALERLGGGG